LLSSQTDRTQNEKGEDAKNHIHQRQNFDPNVVGEGVKLNFHKTPDK
jgi:hypothetical protein